MYDQFRDAILQLPRKYPLTKEDLLRESLHIAHEKSLSMYYSPHNESINNSALILIVGITPGWTQMKTACEELLTHIEGDLPKEEILYLVKKQASFAGSMRSNLIQMLDQCELNKALDLESTATLFSDHRYLLHTTSILKYPVFVEGKNYTGHQPKIESTPLLRTYAYHAFPQELSMLPSNALIIPLGKIVEQTVKMLKDKSQLKQPFLQSFPHPSGANGHRKRQFTQQLEALKQQIRDWKL